MLVPSSLQHPDKCPGDSAAKGRFQALSLVHSVLSDPERRTLYDETGEITEDSDDTNESSGDTWFEYWRALFPKITVADIESFGKKYQRSQEERDDVLDAYKKCRGEMSAMIDSIMLATEADEDRFREIIELAIQQDNLPVFPTFRKGAKRPRSKSKGKRKAKEAAEAEEELASIMKQRDQEKNKGTTSMSTHRARQFNDMVSSLEKRYGGGEKGSSSGKGAKGKRPQDGKKNKKVPSPDISDIDDEEFERIQKKILKDRSK
ncbi:unnamed protein product [Ascophyllum nodosum]